MSASLDVAEVESGNLKARKAHKKLLHLHFYGHRPEWLYGVCRPIVDVKRSRNVLERNCSTATTANNIGSLSNKLASRRYPVALETSYPANISKNSEDYSQPIHTA